MHSSSPLYYFTPGLPEPITVVTCVPFSNSTCHFPISIFLLPSYRFLSSILLPWVAYEFFLRSYTHSLRHDTCIQSLKFLVRRSDQTLTDEDRR
jgi:hypothetical protein